MELDLNKLLIVHYDHTPRLATFDQTEAHEKLKELMVEWPDLPWKVTIGLHNFGQAAYAYGMQCAEEENEEGY